LVILLLSPPSPDREGIVSALLEPGHDLLVVESAAQASASMSGRAVDALLVDLAAGADALKLIRKHRGQRASAPVLCIADRRRPDASSEALRLGVVDIVSRPVQPDDLTAALANAHEFVTVARRPAAEFHAPEQGEGVFGSSPAMRDVLAFVYRVAPSRCGVLIVGERGTGREMIARAIHAQGTRRHLPLIKIVCGDIASQELERVLAGESVPGTTVYLDDVGELPPDAQFRMHAFIRDSQDAARHRGSAGVDPLRFIAGAEPSLFEAAERGRFRPGLLETIAVVRIDLPPLRQRPEDIPLLATVFLKEACRRADVPAKTFSRSALTLLSALPWLGNAAELRSLAERVAVLVPRGVVLLEDVLANVRFEHAEALGRPRDSLRVARERFERDYVAAVLQHHRGRMGAAARDLGIERTNLYRKIKQLNIRWTIPE
jgi:DNA-binding NtrC family response regulator